MNRNSIISIVAATTIAALLPFARIASAQTVSGPAINSSFYESATSALSSIENEQETILANVTTQLSAIALETPGLPTTPQSTPNERAALSDEYTALAQKLSNLANIVSTLTALQNQEQSLAAIVRNGTVASGGSF